MYLHVDVCQCVSVRVDEVSIAYRSVYVYECVRMRVCVRVRARVPDARYERIPVQAELCCGRVKEFNKFETACFAVRSTLDVARVRVSASDVNADAMRNDRHTDLPGCT